MSGLLASLLVGLTRLLAGAKERWVGSRPDLRQRIYFANHTSHLDFLVLWSALPRRLRLLTRPVAARDYWSAGPVRRYLASRVFKAVLVDRQNLTPEARVRQTELLSEALGSDRSLIVFPEGTRGSGDEVAPFKSGLYHLARQRPDVELIPAYLENLNRVLPKGEFLPVPLLCAVSFGSPLPVGGPEAKDEFLTRAREALLALRCS